MNDHILNKLTFLFLLMLLFCSSSVNSQCGEEPTFSNLLWSSYLGGDGEEEVVDIFLDVSTGIQLSLIHI